ncbi:MAG: sulfatase-like hydrolase/transferase [Hyphomonadaceae bacterium]
MGKDNQNNTPFLRDRRRGGLRQVIAVSTAALTLLGCAPSEEQDGAALSPPRADLESKPNIIVILADDLGHYDLSISGNVMVRTPNIDSIGRDGARFQAGYAGDAVCAPSRASLLTGRDFSRFGFEWLPHLPGFIRARDGTYVTEQHPAVLLPPAPPPPKERNGLPDSEITLASALKPLGYHTGLVGKWHLGTSKPLLPINRGFDEFIGFPGGASLYASPDDPSVKTVKLPWSGIDGYLYDNLTTKVWRNGEMVPATKYMTEELGDEAVGFIDRNKASPFFLYLSFNAPHNPIQAPISDYDKLGHVKNERTRTYYAMIENLDAQVGRVLEKLKKDGLEENTLIFFTSDNGGASYHHIPAENLPWRGWKTSYFEGGLNVPYLVRWPAKVSPGTIIPGMTSSLDIFPTALAAAGGALPADREYDGVNILPAITGAEPDSLIDRTLYWRKGDYRAMRHGQWKLQTAKYPNRVWLYDLENDPTERFNLADTMPEKVAELRAIYDKQEEKYVAPAWQPVARTRVDIDGYFEDIGDDVDYVYWAN